METEGDLFLIPWKSWDQKAKKISKFYFVYSCMHTCTTITCLNGSPRGLTRDMQSKQVHKNSRAATTQMYERAVNRYCR